jgi:hypothetical protein
MVAYVYGRTSRFRVKEVAFTEVNFILVLNQQSSEISFTNNFTCTSVPPNNGITALICNRIRGRKADVVTADGVWTET